MKVLRNFSFKSEVPFHSNMPLLSILMVATFFYLSVPSFSQQISGKASFYSNNLHGKRTASGEKYDKNKYTAAHKTYPFGTKLKITHITNGKSTLVTVNDRGPYSKMRLIDLSYAAAKELDLVASGIGDVIIEVVDNTDSIQSAETPNKNTYMEGYYFPNLTSPVLLNCFLLQTGTFNTAEDAIFQISNYEKLYIGIPYIHISRIGEEFAYQVVYAGYETEWSAREQQCKLIESGIESLIIEIK